jgi:lipoate-protein ligase A
MGGSVEVLEQGFPGEAALDVAVSRALLEDVAQGRRSEVLRLYRPDDVVAFSLTDAHKPGFPRAVKAARAAGFDAALRLAGGTAAVFHRETLAFAWCLPSPDPRRGIQQRFDRTADWLVRGLGRLGVDARVGEVAGEYCPGAHSVNARGARKLVGVGQRIVRGAAYVGGVVVVGGTARVRQVLEPVYDALELGFDPTTTGSIADEVGDVSLEDVRNALLDELSRDRALLPGHLDDETLVVARGLEGNHRPD